MHTTETIIHFCLLNTHVAIPTVEPDLYQPINRVFVPTLPVAKLVMIYLCCNVHIPMQRQTEP